MKRFIQLGIALCMAGFLAASCVTTKKIAYLQDMHHGSQIELENTFEAVISPYDELDVIISCFDQELAKPFNLRSAAQSSVLGSTGQNLAYLVDQYGDIELPVLGKIHAAGLTRLKLQDKISGMLISGGYINDPFVMVRFRSFKIFFLGANGGKAITVPNERCTFLEALALSGDMNVYTNRKKIAVLREINGQMTMRYLDPRSSKVFDDPYFMLQQNDFIITRQTANKNFIDSFNQFTPYLTLFNTLMSTASILLLLRYNNLF
jgi:polysaccharide export outer membrane protein